MTFDELVAEHKLEVSAVFVPFSKSRSAKPEPQLRDYNLNWRVTLKKDGRELVTVDYSAGQGHCPSYKQNARPTVDYVEAISFECEQGRKYSRVMGGYRINPNSRDVIISLLSDADVLDYPTFEQWASELGYDGDSRKAETIYRECLRVALILRAWLSDAVLVQLREAAREL